MLACLRVATARGVGLREGARQDCDQAKTAATKAASSPMPRLVSSMAAAAASGPFCAAAELSDALHSSAQARPRSYGEDRDDRPRRQLDAELERICQGILVALLAVLRERLEACSRGPWSCRLPRALQQVVSRTLPAVPVAKANANTSSTVWPSSSAATLV